MTKKCIIYLINTLISEEEIVNIGIRNLMIGRPVISMMGVGGTLIVQANLDIANGKIHNFFTPYDNLVWIIQCLASFLNYIFEDYEEVIAIYCWNLNPVFSRLFQWKSEPWQ